MCYGSVCVCYLSRVWPLFLNAQCCAGVCAVSNGHLQLFACCFSWFWAMYNMWYLSSAMRSASWPWCDLVASFSVHCSETVSALLVIFVTFCADFIKTFSLNQKLLQSRSGLPERPTHGTWLQLNVAFTFHPAAGPTVHGTDFSKHAFQFSAPSVRNLLPQTVLISDSVCFQIQV